MLQEQDYLPSADKDGFINKSILSFMGLLSLARAQERINKDRFKVNPFFRVLFTLVLIVLVSLCTQPTFIYVALAYELVILCVMPVKDVIHVLRISIVVALVSAFIMLPTVFFGNYFSIFMIPLKVLVTLMAVNILSRTTRWDQIIIALRRFRVPHLFILVLDITLKYIVMLGEFTLEMLYALKLRSVGKNRGKHTALSGIAGTLFIKSREMAEEMYQAMECRGFHGEYSAHKAFSFGLADIIYLLINAGIIFVFIYLY